MVRMKMKKQWKKIIFIILIVLIFILIFSIKSSAIDQLIEFIEDPGRKVPEEPVVQIANPILTLIQIISAGVAMGLIIYDGIKLLTTSDNSEKANLKRKLIYYVIGGILIFAPATIIKTLANAGSLIES